MAASIPKNLAIRTFGFGKDASAIVLGVERTNSQHGLFVRGRR